jgi:hypothetical protein
MESVMRIFEGLQSLSARGSAAVRTWLSPIENPFLQKMWRVEARRHKPLVSALIVALLSLAACAAIWNLWLHLQFLLAGHGNLPRQSYEIVEKWLLAVFGRHPVGWFATATAWVGACATFYASRARAAVLLRQELLKNTIVQLQQLPIAEERWVWLMAAHPFALGVLLGALGLPVYALAVFTGQWSVPDVVGLFVLFIFLSHAAPSWTPALWQQSAKGGPQKLNFAQLREWNKEGQAIAQSGDAAGALEHARRMQRALGGLDEEVSTEKAPEKKTGFFGFATNFGGRGNWWWGVVAFNFVFQTGRGIFGSWGAITESWPREITALFPGIILTWPLVFAKLLFAPLPFFALHFPPILLVVPLWLAFSHQSFLNLAANVSAAETFWTPPRLRLRHNLSWLLAALILCFAFGYLWAVLVDGGELSRLIRGAPPLPIWAPAAGWTLTLVSGAFLGGLQMEAPFKRANAGLISAAAAWREAVFILKRMAAFCLASYFLFCWLGGQSGGNPVWLARLPITLATVCAITLADFGSAAVGATLPREARVWWGRLRSVWFHGLAIVALLFIARGAWLNKPFSFEDAPFVLLSPFVTLFSLFRVQAGAPITAQPLVWGALAFQFFIGALCWAAARRALFGRVVEAAPAAGSTPDVQTENDNALQTTTLPARLANFISAALEVPARWLEKFVGAVNNGNDVLLRWSRSAGNAVLAYELRRRLRKENWAWQWLAIFAAQVILFFSIAKPWQLFFAGASPGAGGFSSSNNFADWGAAVTVTVLLLMALVGFVLFLGIARCFDADRANGTLVFLFLTPQTDREILRGKWLCGMVYACGVLAPGVLWLGCGVFAAVVLGFFPATGILAMCALCALVSGLFYVSMISLYFAVRDTKPMQAQGHALLALLMTEGIFAALLIYALVRWSDDLPKIPDEIFAAVLLLFFALTHAVLTFVMWRATLCAFAKRRYGDVEASGKGAN